MEGKGRTGVPFAGKVSRQVMGFQTYFLPVFESNAGVGMGAGTPW
jgi:hypothetical protein